MATGAFPAIQSGASLDPEYQKEYFDALNQSLKSLEKRQEPNLFNVAGAFLNPGRTGSFGEALGNAASVVGKQQEEQEARAPAIAQMRAALAGQKYQIAQEARGMGMLAKAAGVPDESQISNVEMTPDKMQRLMAITPYLTGKPLEMAKTMFGQNKDMLDLLIKQGELKNNQTKTTFETGVAPPVGTEPTTGGITVPRDTLIKTLSDTFKIPVQSFSATRSRDEQQNLYDRWAKGEKGVYMPVNPADHPDLKEFHGNAIDAPQSVPPALMESMGWVRPDPKRDPVHYVPRAMLTPKSQQESILADLSANREKDKAEHAEQLKTQAKGNEPWIEKFNEIASFDPSVGKQAVNNLNTIATIVGPQQPGEDPAAFARRRAVVAAFQKKDVDNIIQGAAKAALQAGSEGVSVGDWKVGAPVLKDIYNNVRLDDGQKVMAERIANALAVETIFNLKLNKSAVGSRVTNYQDQQLSRAVANTDSMPDALYYWSNARMIQHKHEYNLYKDAMRYGAEHGDERMKNPMAYFNPKNPRSNYGYHVDMYGDALKQLDDKLILPNQGVPNAQ